LGIVKAIMRKTLFEGSNLAENLSMLYNTPRSIGGHSPARLFYSRQLRVPGLPQLKDHQEEALDGKQGQLTKRAIKRKRISDLNLKRMVSPLTLQKDQQVLLQSIKTKRWNIPATIVEVRDSGRSAWVKTSSGRKYFRNRRFMRTPPDPIEEDDESQSECDDDDEEDEEDEDEE
jgi:hypothetical protein